MQRFYDKVEVADSGCHLWTAYVMPNGYGTFKFEGRMVMAHRFAYELEVGSIPNGLQIDHLCRIRNCVNTSHLEPVTHKENHIRAAGKHCKFGHPRISENIQWVMENGKRRPRCKPCANRRCREFYHEHKVLVS